MRKTYIMGVDPGIKGALAVIEVTPEGPKFVDVFDFPTVKTDEGPKRIDLYSLSIKIERYSSDTVLAVIEEVGFMKGNEARGTAFTFGHATGAVTGILSGLMITIHTVKPNVWKAMLGLTSDKSLSILKAKLLFPESGKFLTLKKHDGRAEALLLAHWGWKNSKRKQ